MPTAFVQVLRDGYAEGVEAHWISGRVVPSSFFSTNFPGLGLGLGHGQGGILNKSVLDAADVPAMRVLSKSS